MPAGNEVTRGGGDGLTPPSAPEEPQKSVTARGGAYVLGGAGALFLGGLQLELNI